MYKIRKIRFKDHPILKNLEIDFCGQDGKAVDTVLLAGENGNGKSTIINELFRIAENTVKHPCDIQIEDGDKVFNLEYYVKTNGTGEKSIYVNDHHNFDTTIHLPMFKHQYHFTAIYSDVDINFHSRDVSYVTSLTLDSDNISRKSTNDLSTQIKQLLIDIQAMDDAELSHIVRANPQKNISELKINERIPRFTKAFNAIFENLFYCRIENINNQKQIIFKKNNEYFPIDNLSSGEKQIVYRGCFLLKDVNAMNGAFVFIDEPEISLHPIWQKKIMEYYKGIFTNEEGVQTSQIFAVTHSPFIIHNENRKKDKVIVLARNKQGDIVVIDKPEYFKCDSFEPVQDAFCIKDFSNEQSTIYLEGQTDEKYFNKALEVFEYHVPFVFKWIGYIDENGQEVNTGDKSLDKAYHFLVAQNLSKLNICLKDCDTDRCEKRVKNVIIKAIPKYENSKGMKKGIENALVLDDIDLTPFYTTKEKHGNYGETNQLQEFDKMALCDKICAMNNDTLKNVFVNLKKVIDDMIILYNGEQV